MAAKSVPQPLPEKIASLLQEARWLVLAAAALYIGLILFGYDKADPGWSHAAQVARVANPGGRFGAWVADLLLYLFGVSAWWWVLFLLFVVVWGYRRLDGIFATDRRPFLIALAGFLLLLGASSGLEALRFYSMKAALPLGPGGMLGQEAG
ncbi:MAG: DNA translocase FtsK 4TM domain-containing protein, partial [Pseudomonadota bacterium]